MYAMPAVVKTSLYLLAQAATAVTSELAYRAIAPIAGVGDGSYGAADLTDDPYAYLGTPELSGANFSAGIAA